MRKKKANKTEDEQHFDQIESVQLSESKPVPKIEESEESQKIQDNPRGFKKLATFYVSHKKWMIPLSVIVVVAIVFVLPFSRYKVLGMFVKQNESVTVIDSTTNTPVSEAEVQIGSNFVKTNAKGKVSLKIPVGDNEISASKEYYQTNFEHTFVSLNASNNNLQIKLTAIGRQVPITVINKITLSPIENAEVKVLNTEAKTDKTGKAIIVLPAKSTVLSANVTASGYNDASTKTKVTVTDQTVPANTFSLTPTGKFYFLSNLSGNIDVVKTNLDGTGRQTVLPGTGNESPSNTVLLASRDWKYLALQTQRNSSGTTEIDLIDTSNDKMTNIDTGKDVNFTIVGWDGDDFIYQVDRQNYGFYQSGREVIKSYNAQTKSLTTIFQTIAAGGPSGSLGESLGNEFIINGKVVFNVNWNSDTPGLIAGNNKSASLNSVNPDGTNKQIIKNFSNPSTYDYEYSTNVITYDQPNSLAIEIFTDTGEDFYEYQNAQVTTTSELTDTLFHNHNYPTFLESPSGNQTFWSEPADGKYNLFVGDKNGNHQKQVATLSDYSPYGWFTDNYLLVSKNSSELYIIPATGGKPLQITDYFKPSQFNNYGYGGGYGGL